MIPLLLYLINSLHQRLLTLQLQILYRQRPSRFLTATLCNNLDVRLYFAIELRTKVPLQHLFEVGLEVLLKVEHYYLLANLLVGVDRVY